jgi:hypothetical protein
MNASTQVASGVAQGRSVPRLVTALAAVVLAVAM